VALAREKLNGAIKLLKQRQLRMTLKTAGRALAASREALRSEDPVDIDGVHLQLMKKIGEMESAAGHIDRELSAEENEMLREAEKSLGKLWRRKQELENSSGGSRRSQYNAPL
jgi:hypothetical protein